MPYSREIVEEEIIKWHKNDYIPEWLGDFCLLVLAKRITVSLREEDWQDESEGVE
jgi:hypothetical protein